jgi:hypothetical protein
MALIERVDTTMYAPRGPLQILVILGWIASCQTRTSPGECAARATDVTHWLSTIDQSARVIPDADVATLDLVTRDLTERATPGAPIVELGTKRTLFAGEPISEPAELKFRFDRYVLALNGKQPPPLGLAIDRTIAWRRIAETFELAERAGFEQVELYYLALVAPPLAPEKPLDTAACPSVAEALSDVKTLAVHIDPALRGCACRVDNAALRSTLWTALANPHPIRVVRVATDRAGTMRVRPADARWAEVASAIQPGPGWLVAR